MIHRNPGVVHEYIDWAKFIANTVSHCLHDLVVRYISLHWEGRSFSLVDESSHLRRFVFRRSVVDRNTRSVRSQLFSDTATDPPRGTGHNDVLSFE